MRPRTFLSSLLMGFVLVSPLLATSVRLRSKVTVDRPIVTLADIAEVPKGAEQEIRKILDIELMPAPEPGETKWLDLTELRDLLSRKGVSMVELQLIGPRRIEILAGDALAEGLRAAGSRDYNTIIERMLRRKIESSPNWSGRELEISVDGPRTIEFLQTRRLKHWELILPRHWKLGSQVVKLEAPYAGELVRFPIHVVLAEVRPVVVATRKIQRGVKLRPGDIELVSQKFETEDSRWIEDLSQTFDKEVKRTLEAGKPISLDDLKSPPIVFRGSQVTVHVRYGTASLDMFAVAKEDGALGDWIEVVNPTSKRPLQTKVRVIGFQTAEMSGPVAPGKYGSSQ